MTYYYLQQLRLFISKMPNDVAKQIILICKKNQRVQKKNSSLYFKEMIPIFLLKYSKTPCVDLIQQYIDKPHITAQLIQKMSQEQQIRARNKQLRMVVDSYMNEIERLKKVNEQHQAEIETLLKFNERLLIIIQTQLNQYNSKKSQRSYSLQPISEITEKDSEVVDALGSIKASFINLKLNDFDQKQYSQAPKKSGNQTQRVLLGDHLDDALSYEISRSDYQKEYSQYNRGDKVKQVMALINAYKQQYGESVKQCDQINEKMKQEAIKDNQKISNLNKESKTFYGQKMAELSDLELKIKESNPQKQLQNIIKQKKYSAATQKKLMKIMNSIK